MGTGGQNSEDIVLNFEDSHFSFESILGQVPACVVFDQEPSRV